MSRRSNNPLSGNVSASNINTEEERVSADERTPTPPSLQRMSTPTPTDPVVRPQQFDNDYATGMNQPPPTSAFSYRRPPATSGYEDGILATARSRLRQDTAMMECESRGQRPQEHDDTSGNLSDGSSSSETSETSTKRLKKCMYCQSTLAVQDSRFTPKPFTGSSTDIEQVEKWLERFENYIAFRGIPTQQKVQLFKLLLEDQAADWLRTLPDATANEYSKLKDVFRQRFAVSDIQKWQKAKSIWTREQQTGETVDTYVTDIKNMARIVKMVDEEQLRFAVVKGLRGDIKLHVLQSGAATLEAVIKAAKVAEAAITAAGETTSAEVTKLTQQVGELLDQLKKAPPTVNAVAAVPPRTPSPRRVHFGDTENDNSRRDDRSYARPNEQSYRPRPAPDVTRPNYRQQPERQQPNFYNNNRQARGENPGCGNCGRNHAPDRRYCFASNLECYNCLKRGHVSRFCRSAPAYPNRNMPRGRNFGPRQ